MAPINTDLTFPKCSSRWCKLSVSAKRAIVRLGLSSKQRSKHFTFLQAKTPEVSPFAFWHLILDNLAWVRRSCAAHSYTLTPVQPPLPAAFAARCSSSCRMVVAKSCMKPVAELLQTLRDQSEILLLIKFKATNMQFISSQTCSYLPQPPLGPFTLFM